MHFDAVEFTPARRLQQVQVRLGRRLAPSTEIGQLGTVL